MKDAGRQRGGWLNSVTWAARRLSRTARDRGRNVLQDAARVSARDDHFFQSNRCVGGESRRERRDRAATRERDAHGCDKARFNLIGIISEIPGKGHRTASGASPPATSANFVGVQVFQSARRGFDAPRASKPLDLRSAIIAARGMSPHRAAGDRTPREEVSSLARTVVELNVVERVPADPQVVETASPRKKPSCRSQGARCAPGAEQDGFRDPGLPMRPGRARASRADCGATRARRCRRRGRWLAARRQCAEGLRYVDKTSADGPGDRYRRPPAHGDRNVGDLVTGQPVEQTSTPSTATPLSSSIRRMAASDSAFPAPA